MISSNGKVFIVTSIVINNFDSIQQYNGPCGPDIPCGGTSEDSKIPKETLSPSVGTSHQWLGFSAKPIQWYSGCDGGQAKG